MTTIQPATIDTGRQYENTITQAYRLFTEDKNRDEVLPLFDRAFDSYTLWSMRGVWHGEHELTLCFETISNDRFTLDKLEYIARQIKSLNSQEAVLITHHAIDARLI